MMRPLFDTGHDTEELRERYAEARPFPHIVLRDFFDAELLEEVLADFPAAEAPGWRHFRNEHEEKLGYTTALALPQSILTLLWRLNSAEMLGFLEKVAGIDGLIPDPWFGGGGLHRIEPGGFLDMHIDFNLHPKLQLYRRINMLIYLNRGWRREHGGCLELRGDAPEDRATIVPELNTTVIFSTTESSLHGHPEPVAANAPSARRSVSMYYYTARPPDSPVEPHDTIFAD